MTTPVVACLAGCVFALTTASPAYAQEDSRRRGDERQSREVEVTPFVSLGSVYSSRIGAAIAFAWTSQLSVEAEVGYRRSEIDALSSSVSLLYDLPRIGRLAPYLAGGIGLEQYGAPVQIPGSGLVTLRKTAFTVNAGGGVKVPIDDTWAFRADARWINSVGKEGPEHWRLYNGVTFGR